MCCYFSRVIQISDEATARTGKHWGTSIPFSAADCWLGVSMYPEGPMTFHIDTSFLGFPLFFSKYWDDVQVPSGYCLLLMQNSALVFIWMSALKATKLSSKLQVYNSSLIQKKKFRVPCLKDLVLTTLPFSLLHYFYEKYKLAKRGSFITGWCSSSLTPPTITPFRLLF
jgi:hypothetical protein